MAKRAESVLNETVEFLEDINSSSLFDAIDQGKFADIKRAKNGGKGFEGVYEKSDSYWNPFETFFEEKLNIEKGA